LVKDKAVLNQSSSVFVSSLLVGDIRVHKLYCHFFSGREKEKEKKEFFVVAVFESEILDAPRSGVRPASRPLEDILKSVKPTSVRSRRDDTAASSMSAEAAQVLAGLPDLSFMQSHVLMFPIKN
jgi:hypothetical protein